MIGVRPPLRRCRSLGPLARGRWRPASGGTSGRCLCLYQQHSALSCWLVIGDDFRVSIREKTQAICYPDDVVILISGGSRAALEAGGDAAISRFERSTKRTSLEKRQSGWCSKETSTGKEDLGSTFRERSKRAFASREYRRTTDWPQRSKKHRILRKITYYVTGHNGWATRMRIMRISVTQRTFRFD